LGNGRPARFGLRAVPPVALLASAGGLLWLRRLDERPITFLLLLCAGFASLAAASRYPSWLTTKPWPILTVAAALRLLLLPLPPTLSDDVVRYLWDGKVVIAGLDPYALPPDAPELAPLRDEAWQRMSHRDVATVYPPLAMTLFSIAAFGRRPLLLYKGLLVVLDLAGCALLLGLARQLRSSPARTLWYAWNPLVILEGAGMGHVDLLGVPFVVAVLWLLGRQDRRSRSLRTAAAAAAAAGVLVKLVPVVCLPLWARASGRCGRFVVVAVALIAVGVLPVVLSVGGLPPGLVTYGVRWEFNGLLFEPLWRLLALVSLDERLKGVLDVLKSLTGRHAMWNRVYPYVYPQLIAKAVLGVGVLLVVVSGVVRGGSDLVATTRRVLGGALLCSATLYPWYVLWVLPCAALTASVPWLVLSGSVCLSYLPRLFGVPTFPLVYLCVWTPFLVSFVVMRWRRAIG